jgi:pimeloyl-ACP methyl ester carboxylesterase
MPYLELSADFKQFYTVVDFTDPWTRPETVLLVHGFPETTEAWRGPVARMTAAVQTITIP